MKSVHVECKPDELLVSMLGIKRKEVTHHQGKSRIFHALGKMEQQLAIIDEDPGSVPYSYEKTVRFIEESEGISCFSDQRDNKIFRLKGKLEDWIIVACKQQQIKLSSFGLPEKPNDLHDVINQKLSNFEKLVTEMIAKNNPALMKLKSLLN